MTGARLWFVITFAAWTAFAVLIATWINVSALYAGKPLYLGGNIVATFGQMYALGLLTPAFIYVVQKYPPGSRPWIQAFGTYAATYVAVFCIGLPLMAFVSTEFLGRPFTIKTTLGEGIFVSLVYAVALVLVIAVTQVQIANERLARALRLEADLSKLKVEALQRQLHPHFIFNTLNAVGAIMHTDVAAAEEMIAALADLLRSATDNSNRPLVPLREELALLDRYALIMKMRYGDRLTVRVVTEPRTLEIPFPTFTLQPLVENAIVHGLEKSTAGITIDVACRLRGDELVIAVDDDGAPPDPAFQEGVGIGNTRARLAELYGRRANLTIGARESRGASLTLAVPLVPAV